MSFGVAIIAINVFVLTKSIAVGAVRKVQLLDDRKAYRKEKKSIDEYKV